MGRVPFYKGNVLQIEALPYLCQFTEEYQSGEQLSLVMYDLPFHHPMSKQYQRISCMVDGFARKPLRQTISGHTIAVIMYMHVYAYTQSMICMGIHKNWWYVGDQADLVRTKCTKRVRNLLDCMV